VSLFTADCARNLFPRDVYSANFLVMLTAITRAVGPALVECELSFIPRRPINLEIAQQQHHAYEKILIQLGARVISLPAEPTLPDSIFVEDPALVLEELAIVFPLGTETRRREAATIAAALRPFRNLAHVQLPGTIEGGDILRVGRKLYVGLTARSNAEGISQLAGIVAPYGYEVTAIPVTGCLHLKSAVTALDEHTLLANRAWFESSLMKDYVWVEVDPAEPHAGNALAVSGTVVFPASFPRTRARIEARGFKVMPIDICELQKAESGLTCSSLLFDAS
jgi:dimethylargininase